MTSPRFIFAALLASACLTSCGSFEHVDSRYPTVSQQDAYDVSWGLPPRKSRGNPKMRYQYNARAEQAAQQMNVEPPADATLPPAAVAPRPSGSAPTTQPPTVPANLR